MIAVVEKEGITGIERKEEKMPCCVQGGVEGNLDVNWAGRMLKASMADEQKDLGHGSRSLPLD